MDGECILGQENVKREHGPQLDVAVATNFVKYSAEESTEVLVAVKKKKKKKVELCSNSFAAAYILWHTSPSTVPKDSLGEER